MRTWMWHEQRMRQELRIHYHNNYELFLLIKWLYVNPRELFIAKYTKQARAEENIIM